MPNSKTRFIIEEYFKTEDSNLRLLKLQNIFLELIKTCELIRDTSFLDITSLTRENFHE